MKTKRVRKAKRTRRVRGGATPYTFFFHLANGDLEPGGFNPYVIQVEDTKTLIDLGADPLIDLAYNKTGQPLSLTETISSQSSNIPEREIHIQKKGILGPVLDVSSPVKKQGSKE
jgi:hypothetical protein